MTIPSSPTRRTILLLAALTFSSSCGRPRQGPVSVLNVGDPTTANQLLGGFHDVETAAARWTAQEFSVALKPPEDAAARGARLWLRFYIPDSQIEAIGAMTLCVDIDGHPLSSQTYSKGGLYDYSRDVGPELLDTNVVPVHFGFDKSHPPTAVDARELGAVVMEVGLLPNRDRQGARALCGAPDTIRPHMNTVQSWSSSNPIQSRERRERLLFSEGILEQ